MRIGPSRPATGRRLVAVRSSTVLLATLAALLGGPVLAQPTAVKPPADAAGSAREGLPATPAVPAAPYDERLMRLSEILGSVAYLRNLCGATDKNDWREITERLIDRETGAEGERKARLTAAFNRGFRSFAAVYTSCTASAILADERYRAEGATLTAEIVARFGN